jgi:peptidoglycan hydrolase-like protein with peptidoglycan-binding domain
MSVAKVTHDSPLVEARSGDQVVTLRADTLMAIQQALTRGKYLTAPADGTFGPTTAAALRAFQKAESLPETGLPDPATTIRLLIELPTKNK